MPAGQVVEHYVELAPTSNVFRAGDRIRLDVQPAGDAYVGGLGAAPVPNLDPPADCAGQLGFG